MADGVDGSELINNYEEERERDKREKRKRVEGQKRRSVVHCARPLEKSAAASYDGNANAGKVQRKKKHIRKMGKNGQGVIPFGIIIITESVHV